MNELFWVFLAFAIISGFIVSVQAIALAMLTKWNKELRAQVKYLEPPF